MKTKLSLLALAIVVIFVLFKNKQIDKQKNINANNIHQAFLDNHPYQESLKLTRKERKSIAKAPNKYFEQEYLLEMNPTTGETEPEKLFALQEKLKLSGSQKSTPGDLNTDWIERGPNNVPGRTRAMLYDPNDSTHKRVFAAGVSGGLWVINDIENSNASWQRIDIPENLAVSSITVDINNSNIFYIGTGESYVQGSVNGNGVWKSTDGGNSWSHIFGGSTGPTIVINDAEIVVNSPTSIGNFDAIQTSNFGPALTSITGDLVIVDDGTANPTQGCNTLTNVSAINGKIAIIDRANCDFTAKVINAQVAGAIAAIIVNSVDTFPFNMGGEDPLVTIPAVMMGKADGQILKDAIANGNVNITLNPITTSIPAGITLIPGKFHVNDIITRNNGGVTEIYAAITESSHTNGANVLGGEFGLYKSIDGGITWTLSTLPLIAGHRHAPNDLMVTSDNTLWVATTNSWSFGDGGGTVFSSTNGNTFTQKFIFPNGRRTEMAASATNPNLIYLLMSTGADSIELIKTSDAFSTTTTLSKPIDLVVSATDFTGNQSFFNLAISVSPSNDQLIMLGGINTFKSSNGGTSWFKTSWSRSTNNSITNIHSDVHNIIFHPTDSNKGLIGTDGGVFYVSAFNNAESNSNAMESRGNNYNTTQFYKGAIGQNFFNPAILGGTQDNGTQFINNPTAGINSSNRINGGDGMYCFIDKDDQYMVTSIYQNRYYKYSTAGAFQSTIVNIGTEGSFVNIAELDDNLDILYSDAHTGTGASFSAKITRFSGLNGSSVTRAELTDALLTRTISAMKVSPYSTSSTTLLVGTDVGSLLKITNANSSPTWTDLTPEPFVTPFRGSISSINFGANENEIIVTFHNYGVENIFYSEDGGVTWQNKEGDLPDLPVKDILMNPLLNDEVIIATALGVWKTRNFKDASPHWTRSSNGMQNVKVTSFDLRTVDNTVLASTYGRGFFTGQFTADSTAGLDDPTLNNNLITVYPTISNGNFNIKSSKNFENVDLQIFDINGKRVHITKFNLNNTEKNISVNVDKGIYFVNFTGKNLKESHKIIIK